jgi:SSS family solute:Na+ symporter
MGLDHPLPLAILTVYALVTLGIGNLVLRRRLGSDHFLVAARALPLMLVVAVVGGDMLGGASTVGVSQRGYTDGIVGAVFNFSVGIAFFVFAATMAERYRRLRAVTVPEIVGRLFDGRTRAIAAVVIAIAYFVIGVSQIMAAGALLSPLLGIGVWSAELIAAAVFFAIIVAGGLHSIALVNMVQLVVMLGGAIVSVLYALQFIGGSVSAGFHRIWTELPPSFWSLNPGNPLTQGGEMLGTVFNLFAAQAAITGIFAAKDPQVARKGAWLTGVMFLFVGVPFALIGMAARVHFGTELPGGLAAAPAMILALDPVVASIGLCGLFAAIVSTGPLCFLAPVQIFLRDVIGRRDLSDRQRLMISRGLGAAVLGVGWGAAATFEGILNLTIWAYAFRAGIAVVVLSVTYLGTRRISETGAFWGLMTGAAMFAIWTLAGTPYGIHVAIPSMSANFLTTLVVSRIRPRRRQWNEEVTDAFYPEQLRAAAWRVETADTAEPS